MDVIERFVDRIKGRNLRVVLPEGRDERIIRAGRRLKDENIAEPIILGKDEQIANAVTQAGVNLDGIAVINPRQSDKLDVYAEKYIEGRDDISAAVARRMVIKPLFYGGMMIACGDRRGGKRHGDGDTGRGLDGGDGRKNRDGIELFPDGFAAVRWRG